MYCLKKESQYWRIVAPHDPPRISVETAIEVSKHLMAHYPERKQAIERNIDVLREYLSKQHSGTNGDKTMSCTTQCEPGGDSILRAARSLFGAMFQGRSWYEYMRGGKGGDSNHNGRPETDCSWLVFKSISTAGYNVEYLNVPSLLNPAKAGRFYDAVKDVSCVRQGDVMLVAGHAALVDKIGYLFRGVVKHFCFLLIA